MIQITKQKNLNIPIPKDLLAEIKFYAIRRDIYEKNAAIELLRLGLKYSNQQVQVHNINEFTPQQQSGGDFPVNRNNKIQIQK